MVPHRTGPARHQQSPQPIVTYRRSLVPTVTFLRSPADRQLSSVTCRSSLADRMSQLFSRFRVTPDGSRMERPWRRFPRTDTSHQNRKNGRGMWPQCGACRSPHMFPRWSGFYPSLAAAAIYMAAMGRCPARGRPIGAGCGAAIGRLWISASGVANWC
jgi:hypothetical protein